MKDMPIKIHFGDLCREVSEIDSEIQEAIKRVIRSGRFILGKEVEEFEREFANYCGTRYAVGVACGTEAIALALLACGVKPGDEVITVPNTAVPTAMAISMIGAKCVFVDIDENSCLINVSQVEHFITSRTRGIVPVHLYGQMADMTSLIKLTEKYNISIVEDACQAHGAEHYGKKAGAFGYSAAYSFYPSKNLGCYGDGGIIVTDDEDTNKKLKMLRNYGEEKRYSHTFVGFNSRLDEIQAAILRVKLKYLNAWNKRRREISEMYNQYISKEKFKLIVVGEGNLHVYHLYVIQVDRRNEFQKYLEKKGIQTIIHYPVPIHLQTAYRHLGIRRGTFPNAEKVARKIISIPIYPQLKDSEIAYIIECINGF